VRRFYLTRERKSMEWLRDWVRSAPVGGRAEDESSAGSNWPLPRDCGAFGRRCWVAHCFVRRFWVRRGGDFGTALSGYRSEWRGAKQFDFWNMRGNCWMRTFASSMWMRLVIWKSEMGGRISRRAGRLGGRWVVPAEKLLKAKTKAGVDAVGRGEAMRRMWWRPIVELWSCDPG